MNTARSKNDSTPKRNMFGLQQVTLKQTRKPKVKGISPRLPSNPVICRLDIKRIGTTRRWRYSYSLAINGEYLDGKTSYMVGFKTRSLVQLIAVNEALTSMHLGPVLVLTNAREVVQAVNSGVAKLWMADGRDLLEYPPNEIAMQSQREKLLANIKRLNVKFEDLREGSSAYDFDAIEKHRR